jgi:ribosomal protein L3
MALPNRRAGEMEAQAKEDQALRDGGILDMIWTTNGRGTRGGIARDTRITKLTIGRNNDKTIRQRG